MADFAGSPAIDLPRTQMTTSQNGEPDLKTRELLFSRDHFNKERRAALTIIHRFALIPSIAQPRFYTLCLHVLRATDVVVETAFSTIAATTPGEEAKGM